MCVCVTSSSGASSAPGSSSSDSKQVLAQPCLCGFVFPEQSALLRLPSGASMTWCRQGQQARLPSGSADSRRQSLQLPCPHGRHIFNKIINLHRFIPHEGIGRVSPAPLSAPNTTLSLPLGLALAAAPSKFSSAPHFPGCSTIQV